MSQKAHPEYEKLSLLSSRAHMLDGISNLLAWDQEVYMPEMAAPIRAQQRELLAELAHAIKIGKEFEERLSTLIDIASAKVKIEGLSEPQVAALRVYRRDFVREKKLPTSFVQEFTLITSESIYVWQKARANNDFSLFEPSLNKIVNLIRKKADLLGFEEHPYDALLEDYEPGCSTSLVATIFGELKTAITSLLEHIPSSDEGEEFEIAATQEEQVELCKSILELVGFDFRCGRLDLSAHPFSTSYHPFDSRLTTRAESHGILTQILTTLHEVGHSFYDMGRPAQHQGTALGQAVSYGIHESQSRFWETRIGRSLPFWQFLFPLLQTRFPKQLKGISFEYFYQKANAVKPSLIRTDADEVTYPLHVILRFEIEKELLTGTLQVKELPERWRAGMKQLLGVEPKTEAEGCLQDIHWSMGHFGYFPTYSLGNIYAAQMFDTFAKDFPDWEERIRLGQFHFIKEWLSNAVWQHGRRFDGNELIKRISGSGLSSQPFIEYLKTKYGQPLVLHNKSFSDNF